jgi:hypothetical protein
MIQNKLAKIAVFSKHLFPGQRAVVLYKFLASELQYLQTKAVPEQISDRLVDCSITGVTSLDPHRDRLSKIQTGSISGIYNMKECIFSIEPVRLQLH